MLDEKRRKKSEKSDSFARIYVGEGEKAEAHSTGGQVSGGNGRCSLKS